MLRERVGDLTDVHIRVLSLLLDLPDHDPVELPAGERAILVTHDLTPSLTVQLDREAIVGDRHRRRHAHRRTSPFSRARSASRPSSACARATPLADGRRAGHSRRHHRQCSRSARRDAEIDDVPRARATRGGGRGGAQPARRRSRAVTLDGVRVDAPRERRPPRGGRGGAARSGADGVGLMRTEFLVVGRATMPDEEEQYRALPAGGRGVRRAAGGHPHVRHRRRQAARRRVPHRAQSVPRLARDPHVPRPAGDLPHAAARADARGRARRPAHHAAARRHRSTRCAQARAAARPRRPQELETRGVDFRARHPARRHDRDAGGRGGRATRFTRRGRVLQHRHERSRAVHARRRPRQREPRHRASRRCIPRCCGSFSAPWTVARAGRHRGGGVRRDGVAAAHGVRAASGLGVRSSASRRARVPLVKRHRAQRHRRGDAEVRGSRGAPRAARPPTPKRSCRGGCAMRIGDLRCI